MICFFVVGSLTQLYLILMFFSFISHSFAYNCIENIQSIPILLLCFARTARTSLRLFLYSKESNTLWSSYSSSFLFFASLHILVQHIYIYARSFSCFTSYFVVVVIVAISFFVLFHAHIRICFFS